MNENNTSISVANNKQDTRNAALREKETERFNGRVSVSIHSQRNRLTDSDGAFSKYVIDSIITAEILPDDSPDYIPESPRKTQEKLAGQEYTIITIEDYETGNEK